MPQFNPHNYMNPNAEIRRYNNEYYMYTPTKTQDYEGFSAGLGGTVEKIGNISGYDLKQRYGLYPGDIFNATIDPDSWVKNGQWTQDDFKTGINNAFGGFDAGDTTGWKGKVDDLVKQAGELYTKDPSQGTKIYGTVWNNYRNANLEAIQKLQAQNNPARPEFKSQSEALDYAAGVRDGDAPLTYDQLLKSDASNPRAVKALTALLGIPTGGGADFYSNPKIFADNLSNLQRRIDEQVAGTRGSSPSGEFQKFGEYAAWGGDVAPLQAQLKGLQDKYAAAGIDFNSSPLSVLNKIVGLSPTLTPEQNGSRVTSQNYNTGEFGQGTAGTDGANANQPISLGNIPFKTGLSDDQKASIAMLMSRTTALNETDAKNYGFATGTDPKQYVGKTPQQILAAMASGAGAGGGSAGGAGGTKGQPTPLTDPSIENFLVAVGLPSDIAARQKMAQERGITGYRGTADQNTRLLGLLRKEYDAGTLGKPTNPSDLPKGSGTGTGQDQGQTKDPQSEIDRINAEANSLQDNEHKMIEENAKGKVDISQSQQLTEKLLKMLEGKQEQDKAAPSLQQQFLDQRTKLGVGEMETKLAGLDAKLEQLDADYASAVEGEEGRLVSMSQVQRRQSAEGIAYQRARRDMVAERDSVANQLNTKYGVIKSMVDFAGMDYDNAQQNYQTQFNSSLQLINLVKGIENEAKDNQEKAVDNARANATIMYNLLKEGNVKYDSLDASAKADIKNLEMMAGLPTGFTEFITSAIDEPVIHFGTAFTDAKGDRIQPVLTVDKATGNVNTNNVIVGKDKAISSNNNNGDTEDAAVSLYSGIMQSAIDSGASTADEVLAAVQAVAANSEVKLSIKQLNKIRAKAGALLSGNYTPSEIPPTGTSPTEKSQANNSIYNFYGLLDKKTQTKTAIPSNTAGASTPSYFGTNTELANNVYNSLFNF